MAHVDAPNGLELSRSAGVGNAYFTLAPIAGQGTVRFEPACRVGSSELLGRSEFEGL